jgi:CRISPR-associated protein Cmr2
MTRDHIVYGLQRRQDQLNELYKQEQNIEAAKQQRDKPKQKDAEKAAEQARRALLRATRLPVAIYEFFTATERADDTALRTTWQEMTHDARNVDLLEELAKDWKAGKSYYEDIFKSPKIDLTVLPAYTFVIQFTFTLVQPYISRDEQNFYIIDNPVRKDKVFGLPYVASTSWKGSLRAALWQLGHREQGEPIRRLFGNEKGAEDQKNFRAGRLYFYPTFFTHKSLEMINPQDRRLRSGKDPILFESVPKDTPGVFTLLYVPFDIIGENEQETRTEVAGDLQLVATGLQAMFRTYGFGAKTSSGFGLAREDISGSLTLRISQDQRQMEAEIATIAQPALPPLPRYLETDDRLKPEYLTSEGTFRERSEAELKKMSKVDRQLYEKAKGWWERRSKKQVEATKVPEHVEPASPESLPPAQLISWPKREFNSFEQLSRVVEKLAEQLKGGSKETYNE